MTPVIIGASVRGDSHIRHGIECQDSFLIIDGIHETEHKNGYYKKMDEDVRIVSVADGHGSNSCPYSKTGSRKATEVFCDIMAEYAAKYKQNMEDLFVALNQEGETARIAKSIITEWEKRIIMSHINSKDKVIPMDENGNRDDKAIWKQYGTTLLGALITSQFIFFLQLGDGDITCVNSETATAVIEGDKILGVETHSISKFSSWKKVLTKVVRLEGLLQNPMLYILSTDGWTNSHVSQDEFYMTCKEYYQLIQERGLEIVENNLESWLSETSRLGCGDDITAVLIYYDNK